MDFSEKEKLNKHNTTRRLIRQNELLLQVTLIHLSVVSVVIYTTGLCCSVFSWWTTSLCDLTLQLITAENSSSPEPFLLAAFQEISNCTAHCGKHTHKPLSDMTSGKCPGDGVRTEEQTFAFPRMKKAAGGNRILSRTLRWGGGAAYRRQDMTYDFHCWAHMFISTAHQSIKFYLYSPYSQITICLIGL